MNNSNLKLAVPFFMVSNIEASLEFYIKGLGFEQKMEWKPNGKIEWCYLQRGEVGLMLQEYRKVNVPNSKLGLGVSICFICDDALILYNEFLQHGLTPNEPFVGNNMWVTSMKDPDGYSLDFESITEVPEETTYTDWLSKTNEV